MKIYFSVSVRAGREGEEFLPYIVNLLKSHGEVLAEENGALNFQGVSGLSDGEIFERDMSWLKEADILVAEVTNPSLGVGYEIASALNLGKRVLCLYREIPGKKLSGMINGDKKIIVKTYKTAEDLPAILEDFFDK